MITLGEIFKVIALGAFVLIVMRREKRRSRVKEIHNFLGIKK